MYPPDFGNSSYMVSVPLEEVSDAVSTLRVLFETAGYRGIFSAEFKLDERDGRFKILEVNARPWWYIQFAAECGVDVVEMAYCDALGLELPPVPPYKVGTRLVFAYYDFQALKEARGSAIGMLSGIARSWPLARTPIFAWDDPGPAFADLGERFKGRLTRFVGRGGA
jgi:predicted ATP-grasp superfamily ATP-dependent carboligase